MNLELIEPGSVNKLQSILDELNGTKVFLVTGKASFDKLTNKSVIENALKGREVLRHSDFEVNPNFDDIVMGVKKLNSFAPEVVIGIGGGSVLDTAKLIHSLPPSAEEIRKAILTGILKPIKKVPLIAVPTTAGSGAESTHFSVVYINEVKYSLASEALLPEIKIVDSECTLSMPPKLTAITAMDALSQAIESFWAINANEESRLYAAESIKLNLSVFDRVVTKSDASSREIMMRAAFLAGKAINISKTTAAHAYSYYLTKKFGIPHGQAVGLLLPVIILYNSEVEKINIDKTIHKKRLEGLKSLFGVKDMREAAEMIYNLLNNHSLLLRFHDLGYVKKTDFAHWLENVNPQRLSNNPVEVHEELLLKYLLTINNIFN